MAGTGAAQTMTRGTQVSGKTGPLAATIEGRMADAVRALSIHAVDAAQSGHSGLAVAMAGVVTVLWSRVLRFDASDPRWPDRDRFVMSAGHGSVLLYSLLHLTGHAGMDTGALQRFGQLDSPAAGHPEHGDHPAIEATTGQPGQGFAAAVGMALAERMMAARFGRSLVDHRTWVVACGDDVSEGVCHEAASLAGHLGLAKLTVLCVDNPVGRTIEGAGDPVKRFAAAGWATKRVNANDAASIAAALAFATRSKKPTLIACDVSASSAARDAHNPALPDQAPFDVHPDLANSWRQAGGRGTGARRAWLKRLANHPLRGEFDRVLAGRLPETWHEVAATCKSQRADRPSPAATSGTSQSVLSALTQAIPELAVGSLAPECPDGGGNRRTIAVSAGNYAGQYVPYGRREHAMAACLNGMALHGGLIPCASAALVATDCMRPALRLAALMRQRVIHVLSDDSIGVGEDGPAYQPVEQLASLRAMPGLAVLRPADAIETVECWELAIRRADGPSLLVLSRQSVPPLRTDAGENRCARGGYVLAEADGARQATLIASGSEVSVALEARRLLAEAGLQAAVVSLPCWTLFGTQDEGYRAQVLGAGLRVGIEAACGFGWERWLGTDGIFVGMTGFGASAPCETLYRHFGITPEAVATAVRKRLQPVQQHEE